MEEKVLSVLKKRGYEIRVVEMPPMGEDPTATKTFTMERAYTEKGDYIGDPKTAAFLIERFGIAPEKISPDSNICSIGFCAKAQKWYGWSHRAIVGFGIGDRIFEEDYGNDRTLFIYHGSKPIVTLEDAKLAATRFAEYVS